MPIIYNSQAYKDRLQDLKTDIDNKYKDLLEYQHVNFAKELLDDYNEDMESKEIIEKLRDSDEFSELPRVDFHYGKHLKIEEFLVLGITEHGVFAAKEDDDEAQDLKFDNISSIEGKMYLLTCWENHIK